MPVGALNEGERPPWLLVRIGDLRAPAAELVDSSGDVVAREGQVGTLAGLLVVGGGIVQCDRGRAVGRSDFQSPGSPAHVLVGDDREAEDVSVELQRLVLIRYVQHCSADVRDHRHRIYARRRALQTRR